MCQVGVWMQTAAQAAHVWRCMRAAASRRHPAATGLCGAELRLHASAAEAAPQSSVRRGRRSRPRMGCTIERWGRGRGSDVRPRVAAAGGLDAGGGGRRCKSQATRWRHGWRPRFCGRRAGALLASHCAASSAVRGPLRACALRGAAARLASLQPAAGPCMRRMQGVACGGMLVDASLPASLVWSWSAGMWSVAGRAASVPGPRTVKAPCGGSGPWFSQAAVVFPCSERCGGMYMARFHGRVAPGCVHFAVRRSSSSCAEAPFRDGLIR